MTPPVCPPAPVVASSLWFISDIETAHMSAIQKDLASTALYDVAATVCDQTGVEGACYDLDGENQSIDEILATLRAILMRRGDWVTGDTQGSVYLNIMIGMPGSHERLPV